MGRRPGPADPGERPHDGRPSRAGLRPARRRQAGRDRDPVFDSFSDSCRLDPGSTRDAVAAAFGSGLTDPPTDAAVRAIWEILRPGEAPGPSSVAVKHDGIELEGSLGVAAPASEIMLLEYAQGMPAADTGWGLAATPARIAPLLAARNRGEAITERLPT